MMNEPAPARKPARRLWWLLAILGCLLVVGWMQRHQLTALPKAWARRSLAARDDQQALRALETAQRISNRDGETEFLLGRLARRQGRMDDAIRHLKRARYLGLAPATLQREEWLVLAQSGQMTAAEPHLVELLNDPQGDGAEICEAFVVGYLFLRNFAAATELLDAWSRDYPRDAQTHYSRGLMHMDLLNLPTAEEQLRRAVELSPTHADALFWLADLLLDGGRADEALGYFERLCRLRPDDLTAAVGQASCLRCVGRSAEARELLERVLTVSANNEALVELANLDIEDGDYESARARVEPAVKANPQHKDLRYVYGIALRNLGRMDEAREQLDFVVEVSKRLDHANVLAAELSSKPGDVDLRYQIGEIHLRSGGEKEGLVWLNSALACDPRHKPTHRLLAEYYSNKAGDDLKLHELARHHQELADLPDQNPAPESPAKSD